MSNEEEKEVTNTTANPEKPKRLPWKGIMVLGLLLAVIVLLYLAIHVYDHSSRVNQKLLGSTTESQQKIVQLQNNFLAVQKTATDAEAAIQELRQGLQNLKSSQMQMNNKAQWAIDEARYLVKLADNALQFEQDRSQALLALKMADEQIRDLSDPTLEDVRKALAGDIANVQSVPEVDVTGLYLKLSALNDQIDRLPLINKAAIPAATIVNANEVAQAWWQRGLQKTWQELRQLVVIRYNQTDKLPFIAPDQQAYLYQNLHAKLSQAIWALLHRQTDIYQQSLQQTAAWVKEYFVTDSSISQAVLNDITELQQVDIHPTMPKITTSLQSFEQLKN